MVEAVERKSRTHKKLPTSFTIFLWFHLVSCAIWSSKFVCLSMFGCRFVWWGSNISIGNQKDNNVSNGLPSGNKSTPFQNIFLLSLHTCQSEEKCACLLHQNGFSNKKQKIGERIFNLLQQLNRNKLEIHCHYETEFISKQG